MSIAPFEYGSTTVKDVAAHSFIKTYAAHLKKGGKLEVPKWADYAKTASFKELGPMDPDWFYTRCAAIARRVYLRPGQGVGSFNRIFGGRDNNDGTPARFKEGSGAVNRAALMALEKLKLVEKTGKGRRVTKEGQKDLDRIAVQVAAVARK